MGGESVGLLAYGMSTGRDGGSQKISERHCLAIGLRLGKVGATVSESGVVVTTFTAVEGGRGARPRDQWLMTCCLASWGLGYMNQRFPATASAGLAHLSYF